MAQFYNLGVIAYAGMKSIGEENIPFRANTKFSYVRYVYKHVSTAAALGTFSSEHC